MEIREEMLPTLNELYEDTETSKIYHSNSNIPDLVESPQSPSCPPPPYQKVSPTVIQWQSKCMKDNDTPGSNRSYRTIPPALINPYDEEALQKVQKSIDNASVRSNKPKWSPTAYQPPTYDPKVLKQHMRPVKSEIYVNKSKDDMDMDHDGGDGGDGGGIYAFS
jgi:hypothetical protein